MRAKKLPTICDFLIAEEAIQVINLKGTAQKNKAQTSQASKMEADHTHPERARRDLC